MKILTDIGIPEEKHPEYIDRIEEAVLPMLANASFFDKDAFRNRLVECFVDIGFVPTFDQISIIAANIIPITDKERLLYDISNQIDSDTWG